MREIVGDLRVKDKGGGCKGRFLLEAIEVVAMRPAPAEDQQPARR